MEEVTTLHVQQDCNQAHLELATAFMWAGWEQEHMSAYALLLWTRVGYSRPLSVYKKYYETCYTCTDFSFYFKRGGI